MNIGIFVPFMNNFGRKGFYNSQEIGLAKELSKSNNNIIIFKLVRGKTISEENINSNCKILYIPAKAIGINGIITDFDIIKKYKVERLVVFSDTQIIIKRLYSYCKKNSIQFIPYVGVIESSSNNKLKQKLMKCFITQNIKVYKKCDKIIAKTPKVLGELQNLGIKNLVLAPVGLDFDLLNNEFNSNEKEIEEIKAKLSYKKEDKIILFIGRLDKQKNPLLAIDILKKLLSYDKNYKMIMIGKGILKKNILEKINENNLNNEIKCLEQIPNNLMWKYYAISECFINLNKDEIFGMAILEAMYYRCPVVAIEAPGPNFIIDNNINGILMGKLEYTAFAKKIINLRETKESIRNVSKAYIEEKFSWKICSIIIQEGIDGIK